MNRIQLMALKLDVAKDRHTPVFLENLLDATVSDENKRTAGFAFKSLPELPLRAKPTVKTPCCQKFSLDNYAHKKLILILAFGKSYVFMIGEGEHVDVYTAPDVKPR